MGAGRFIPEYMLDVIHEINIGNGFGGHLILGPVTVFIREFVATGMAVWIAVSVAPSNKKTAFFSLIALFILYLLVAAFGVGATLGSYEWTSESIFRSIVETVAQVTALIMISLSLYRDNL